MNSPGELRDGKTFAIESAGSLLNSGAIRKCRQPTLPPPRTASAATSGTSGVGGGHVIATAMQVRMKTKSSRRPQNKPIAALLKVPQLPCQSSGESATAEPEATGRARGLDCWTPAMSKTATSKQQHRRLQTRRRSDAFAHADHPSSRIPKSGTVLTVNGTNLRTHGLPGGRGGRKPGMNTGGCELLSQSQSVLKYIEPASTLDVQRRPQAARIGMRLCRPRTSYAVTSGTSGA